MHVSALYCALFMLTHTECEQQRTTACWQQHPEALCYIDEWLDQLRTDQSGRLSSHPPWQTCVWQLCPYQRGLANEKSFKNCVTFSVPHGCPVPRFAPWKKTHWTLVTLVMTAPSTALTAPSCTRIMQPARLSWLCGKAHGGKKRAFVVRPSVSATCMHVCTKPCKPKWVRKWSPALSPNAFPPLHRLLEGLWPFNRWRNKWPISSRAFPPRPERLA